MLSTVPEPSKYAITSSYIDNDLLESPSKLLSLNSITGKWGKKLPVGENQM